MIYKKIVLFIALVLISTAFIFSNSLKNQEESKADSDVIVEIIEHLASKIKPNNTVEWSSVVRKSAHLFEFCVLGVFAMFLSLRLKKECWKTIILGFLYVFFIACADEFIQRFTGRGAAFSDVMIDVVGATIGIGLFFTLNLLTKRVRNSLKKKDKCGF